MLSYYSMNGKGVGNLPINRENSETQRKQREPQKDTKTSRQKYPQGNSEKVASLKNLNKDKLSIKQRYSHFKESEQQQTIKEHFKL